MTDVWDVARYVESHPENKEQRWRLAKKFYLADEYRHAAEHLSILSNEMPESINVRRYLAATLFRLNRFDDAVRVLGEAIAKWPDEPGLCEQLARTLRVAGKPLDAADAWERAARLNPSHPYAKRAAETLRQEEYAKGARPVSMDTSTPGGTASPDISCPHCGAGNYPEFERCRRCNAPLNARMTWGPRDTAPTAGNAFGEPGFDARRWGGRIVALATISMLSAAVYFAARQFLADRGTGEVPASWTMNALLASELALAKALVGIVLLPVWPTALYMTMGLFGLKPRSERTVIQAGLFLASLTTLLLWLPGHLVWLAAAVPLAVSAIAAVFLLGIPSTHSLLVWLVQGATVSLAGLVPLLAVNGPGFVLELPTILRQCAITAGHPPFKFSGTVPFDLAGSWDDPGSSWLAAHASSVTVVIESGPHSEPISVGLMAADQTVFFREITGDSLSFVVPRMPLGEALQLRVSGPPGTALSLEFQGLFVPEFRDASMAP